MKQKTKTAIIIAASVAAVAAIAVSVWIIRSKRRNGGLIVIGNVTQPAQNQETDMNQTNHFSDTSLPRGYRNNNPLNVRKSAANAWKGKVVPGTDSAFEQFVTMAYGYRCALYLIRKYIGQGHDTIRKIITKWAPPSENNTTGYIANVASRSGIGADTKIARTDMDSLCRITYEMARIENGKAPDSMDDIYKGWMLL